jgi:hypothetical protein
MNQVAKTKKLSAGKFLILFLLAAAFVIGLDYLQVKPGSKQEQLDPGNQVSETPDPTTISAQTSAAPKVEGESTRKVTVFIDKNANGQKDSNESSCDVCVAKALMAGSLQNGLLKSAAKTKTVNIGSKGVIKDTDLADVNTVWAYFEDRQILIEPQTVAVNDGSSDVQIAAIETQAGISGINANISKATDLGQGSEGERINYGFMSLIPSFQVAADQGKDLWVQYIPDSNNSGVHFIAKGKLHKDTTGSLSGSSSGYYLEVSWPFGNADPKLLSQDNLKLFLI